MDTSNLVSEVIAFTEFSEDENKVLILLATGMEKEDFSKASISIRRLGMQFSIYVDDQEYFGKSEDSNFLNWKYAQIGSLDNDLQMAFSNFIEINFLILNGFYHRLLEKLSYRKKIVKYDDDFKG